MTLHILVKLVRLLPIASGESLECARFVFTLFLVAFQRGSVGTEGGTSSSTESCKLVLPSGWLGQWTALKL
jgi:hypothetical protein